MKKRIRKGTSKINIFKTDVILDPSQVVDLRGRITKKSLRSPTKEINRQQTSSSRRRQSTTRGR